MDSIQSDKKNLRLARETLNNAVMKIKTKRGGDDPAIIRSGISYPCFPNKKRKFINTEFMKVLKEVNQKERLQIVPEAAELNNIPDTGDKAELPKTSASLSSKPVELQRTASVPLSQPGDSQSGVKLAPAVVMRPLTRRASLSPRMPTNEGAVRYASSQMSPEQRQRNRTHTAVRNKVQAPGPGGSAQPIDDIKFTYNPNTGRFVPIPQSKPSISEASSANPAVNSPSSRPVSSGDLYQRIFGVSR